MPGAAQLANGGAPAPWYMPRSCRIDSCVSVGQLRASSWRFSVFQNLQSILNLAREQTYPCYALRRILAHSAEGVNRGLSSVARRVTGRKAMPLAWPLPLWERWRAD